ncbi:MAG: AbrB/MazE/SpoVT family DNA-binding domain-containing protein [Sulfolobales archaeon]
MEDYIYREIVSVDLKGRVTIPKYIREEIGLVEGGKVLLEIDKSNRRLVIKPIDIKTRLCSVIGEGVESIEEYLSELAKYREKTDIDIIDLRCYKLLDEKYECRAIISLKDQVSCEMFEKLSKILVISPL